MWCKTIDNRINVLSRAGLVPAHKQMISGDYHVLTPLCPSVLCEIQSATLCTKDVLDPMSKHFQLTLLEKSHFQ